MSEPLQTITPINPHSLVKERVRRWWIVRNPAFFLGVSFLILLTFVTIFAPLLLRFSYTEQDLAHALQPPDSTHWLGTDALGRDMLSRVVYGARVSLMVGLLTSFTALFIGTIYGIISGYCGKLIDLFMMRFIDFFYALPDIVLMILFTLIFSALPILNGYSEFKTLFGICLALSILNWVGIARLVRGNVLRLGQMEFIEAARTLGGNPLHITLRHLLPNLMGPIIVALTYTIPTNILYESFLSFIGLGLHPPYASWGVLSSEGWQTMRSYPHLIISPALALIFTTLAFNLIGDKLRDILDPRYKEIRI